MYALTHDSSFECLVPRDAIDKRLIGPSIWMVHTADTATQSSEGEAHKDRNGPVGRQNHPSAAHVTGKEH
jgi:hypothetical protein